MLIGSSTMVTISQQEDICLYWDYSFLEINQASMSIISIIKYEFIVLYNTTA